MPGQPPVGLPAAAAVPESQRSGPEGTGGARLVEEPRLSSLSILKLLLGSLATIYAPRHQLSFVYLLDSLGASARQMRAEARRAKAYP